MIIPFFIPHAGCAHQCVFCNQKNITGKVSSPDPRVIPLAIRARLEASSPSAPVQVAFYGGSFTALTRELQRSYLEAVQPFVDEGSVAAIRLSTRPDAVSAETLTFLKRYPVSTVELGAQSMDDRVLSLSGRGHSAEHTVRAVHLIREHSFSVGLQLMPGLPGDSADIFARTVDRTIELRPDIVRIYPALVIRDTPLETMFRTGSYSPLSLEEAVVRCGDALDRFEQAGVTVIRIGLQPTEELERPGTIVAGPYHPAFRQLVGSSLMLAKMRALLASAKRDGSSEITLSVHPADLSTAIGQKRANVRILRQEFALLSLRFEPDSTVPKGQVRSHPSCFRTPAGV